MTSAQTAWLAGVMLATVLGGTPRAAHAQSAASAPEPTRSEGFTDAKRLHEAGRLAEQQGDWQGACEQYRASVARAERPANLFKVAVCLRRERHFVAAWNALQRAKALNRDDPASAKPEFEAEVEQELGLIPTVRVDLPGDPAGWTIALDGEPLEHDALGRLQPVDLGPHWLRAEAPGYEPAELRIIVERQQPYAVTIPLQRVQPVSTRPTAAPVPSEPPRPVPPSTSDVSPRRTWAYVFGGVGGAGLISSGVLGVITLELVAESNAHCDFPGGECDPEGMRLRRRALRFQTIGLSLAGASLVALAGGLYLVVSDEPSTKSTARLRGSVGLGDQQLVGRLEW